MLVLEVLVLGFLISKKLILGVFVYIRDTCIKDVGTESGYITSICSMSICIGSAYNNSINAIKCLRMHL